MFKVKRQDTCEFCFWRWTQIRIVVVGCNHLGILVGRLLSEGNEVQYLDWDETLEPKTKIKWDIMDGELYIFTEYHPIEQILSKKQVQLMVSLVDDNERIEESKDEEK